MRRVLSSTRRRVGTAIRRRLGIAGLTELVGEFQRQNAALTQALATEQSIGDQVRRSLVKLEQILAAEQSARGQMRIALLEELERRIAKLDQAFAAEQSAREQMRLETYEHIGNSLARVEQSGVRREPVDYVLGEVSELRELVRILCTESATYNSRSSQTRASFNYQWGTLPEGINLLSDPEFCAMSARRVCELTKRDAFWFEGRKVLDAGCGNGRWTHALCSLGAKVTAIDASEAGLADVARHCAEFSDLSFLPHNLLEPLPLEGAFDLVWCFGVAHHTGDTRKALSHVAKAVAPGGYLFAMIYGEPRPDHLEDFVEITTYTNTRRALAGLSFDQRVEYIRDRFGAENLNGWFDALSPQINDLHRYDEIVPWLIEWGFVDIERTADNRNHHFVARRAL